MKKKIFYDTEFIEKDGFVDIVSLGAVDESGNTFYEISSEFNESRADDWVKENVLSYLGDEKRITKKEMGEKFRKWCGEPVELFAYYSSFDHVVLMSLYGRMVDAPKILPFYSTDLKQMMDQNGITKKPADPENEHHALEDAKWNLELFKSIKDQVWKKKTLNSEKQKG